LSMIPNPTLKRLREGKLALGFGAYHLRTSAAAMLTHAIGYDWLFIDTEHGAFTVQEASQMSYAAIPLGITPIVRICAGALDEGTRALDNGAMGIVVPHVDTGAQAARITDAFRFPPMGSRSWGAPPAAFLYGGPPMGEAQAVLNREILICVMIESAEAVANAGDIAATEGIDVLMIGTADLTTELGIPGQWGHEKVQDAYRRVGAACRKYGKFAAAGGLGDPDWAAHYIRGGVHMILAGTDHRMIMEAGARHAAFYRGLEGKGAAAAPKAKRG